MPTLARRIGVVGATGVGLSAMLGAGVFTVWGPAASSAGDLLLLGLAIAGVVAVLNALSTTRLAIAHPTAGGVYRYGLAELGEASGLAAGVLFLAGKTASAALIAGVAARYALPDAPAGAVAAAAAGAIAVLALVNATGIRSTAAVAGGIVLVTVTVLVIALGMAAAAPAAAATASPDGPIGPFGVLAAANAIFFAFAGYARIATLSEEVRRPERTLVAAVLASVTIAALLYAAVGAVLVSRLGSDGIAGDAVPLLALVDDGWRPVLAGAAVLASLGSLLGVLAGLSRTGFAMARDGRLPGPLATVHPRTGGPLVAEGAVAVLAIVATVLVPPALLIGLSSCAVLGYYAIGHAASFRRGGAAWRVVAVAGLLGCVVVAVSAPWVAVLAVLFVAAATVLGSAVSRRRRRA